MPEPTEAQKALAARIAELKTAEGKTFVRRDGTGTPTRVIRYDGVKVHQEFKDGKPVAISSHTFLVESGTGRWTPPATQFLAEHEEIEAPAETQNAGQIL